MKAKEVLRLLRISRPTLRRYVKNGIIRVHKLPTGYYDYNDEDVYRFLNKDVPRKNYIYARVSTKKQKKDLENQIEMLKTWCFNNGIKLSGIFHDYASGINFENRKEFFSLLEEIMNYKVSKVIVAHKDRLSRVGFTFFERLFSRFGTEIIVVSDVGNKKLDSEEIFEEIISLLHCYSMKFYSNRKNKKLILELKDDGN